jgi:hypothetical protein
MVWVFVENQEAVLAVVLRPRDKDTEFVLPWNNNYDGYFVPSQYPLGQSADSRSLTTEVRHMLRASAKALVRQGLDADITFDYWAPVILAGTELLPGELAQAWRTCRRAFAQHLVPIDSGPSSGKA